MGALDLAVGGAAAARAVVGAVVEAFAFEVDAAAAIDSSVFAGIESEGAVSVQAQVARATESEVASSAAQSARLRAALAADEILTAERVGSGPKADRTHRAASFLSREQLESGQVVGIRGGDGVQRTLLQTRGDIDGQQGIYEYIVTSDGTISQQRFIAGGSITGLPNHTVRF